MKIMQKDKPRQTGIGDSKELAALSDKVKSLSTKLTKELADLSRKSKSDITSLEQKIDVMKKDRSEKVDQEGAKKEVNQMIELRTSTLQVQYDQIRADFNAHKEETDITVKNTVADIAKLHRTMAKTSSLS